MDACDDEREEYEEKEFRGSVGIRSNFRLARPRRANAKSTKTKRGYSMRVGRGRRDAQKR